MKYKQKKPTEGNIDLMLSIDEVEEILEMIKDPRMIDECKSNKPLTKEQIKEIGEENLL